MWLTPTVPAPLFIAIALTSSVIALNEWIALLFLEIGPSAFLSIQRLIKFNKDTLNGLIKPKKSSNLLHSSSLAPEPWNIWVAALFFDSPKPLMTFADSGKSR